MFLLIIGLYEFNFFDFIVCHIVDRKHIVIDGSSRHLFTIENIRKCEICDLDNIIDANLTFFKFSYHKNTGLFVKSRLFTAFLELNYLFNFFAAFC